MLSPPPRLTSPQRRGKVEGISARERKRREGDKSKANFSLCLFLNDDNLIFSVCRMVVLMFELLPNLLCPHSPSLISFFPSTTFFLVPPRSRLPPNLCFLFSIPSPLSNSFFPFCSFPTHSVLLFLVFLHLFSVLLNYTFLVFYKSGYQDFVPVNPLYKAMCTCNPSPQEVKLFSFSEEKQFCSAETSSTQVPSFPPSNYHA